MANLTYVKCDACGRVVEGSSGACSECGAALAAVKARSQSERDWVHATERPERESTLLPGAAPQDRVSEFDTALAQHGAAEQDRPSALAQPEQDKDKKEGGSVVGTFISGGVSLGIGVVGILSSDSFSIWSFALIAMGALAIFNGLRKMAKNSDK